MNPFWSCLETQGVVPFGAARRTHRHEAFEVADFLDWLARETIKQIESGQGAVVRQRHKVGKRFYIEYEQNGFTGRLEVDADVTGKDQLSLDVEIIESTGK
jgi:hypothetical protein